MNVLTLFIPAFVLFYLAYKFYARYISKVFEEDDNNLTPACKINDGVDYVPTKPVVLFGHHFASIALTSLVPLNTLGLDLSQQILKTKVIDNIAYAQIGGIASTSVIVITLFSPLVGYLLYTDRGKLTPDYPFYWSDEAGLTDSSKMGVRS